MLAAGYFLPARQAESQSDFSHQQSFAGEAKASPVPSPVPSTPLTVAEMWCFRTLRSVFWAENVVLVLELVLEPPAAPGATSNPELSRGVPSARFEGESITSTAR